MKLRKMLLLASMALTAIAFAAPAAAQAEELSWSESGEISGEGSMTWSWAYPTPVFHFTFSGEVEGDEATITDFTIDTTPPISLWGTSCWITKAEAPGLPWSVQLSGPDKMTVADMALTFYYSPAPGGHCWGWPNPTPIGMAGDMHLQVTETDPGEGRCAGATPYVDDIVRLGSEEGFDLTGYLCWDGPAITGLEEP